MTGDLGFANLDFHRAARQGFAEVVYCAGKTPAQTAAIFTALAARQDTPVLGTRASGAHYEAVKAALPGAVYHETARILTSGPLPAPRPHAPSTLLLTAGTSDLPVAEEAAVTLEALGWPVTRAFDVGVAGLHRIIEKTPLLQEAAVVIVVAGMEGALPSVAGGLTAAPVIAVPTSVGYGASFNGLSALLGMLNSCASGLTVVNIDNGFGAAMAAHRILNREESPPR